MLSFVQSWFAPKANPIGVDFGSDCLRLAQVQFDGTEHKLLAAGSATVPHSIRKDPAARSAFFVESVRELLASGRFRGRSAVLALPAASTCIQHLRMAPMEEGELKKALAWEARGRMPIDPANALMRHVVAGDVYQDQDPKKEVIVFAAARELIARILSDAAKAKLDVVGMHVEPRALVDCFAHVWRRKNDSTVATCFLDIGLYSSRAVIALANRVMFARTIAVGGDHLTRAVAQALEVDADEARLLRIKHSHAHPSLDEYRAQRQLETTAAAARPSAATRQAESNGFALLDAGVKVASRNGHSAKSAAKHVARRTVDTDPDAVAGFAPAAEAPDRRQQLIDAACNPAIAHLASEVDLCRRYFEATFPNDPVGRLVFVGGEASHRGLCQQVARQLGISAQVGDPLVRMGRISDIGIETGIDRRMPQPAWAVAIGLSLGAAPALPVETQGIGASNGESR